MSRRPVRARRSTALLRALCPTLALTGVLAPAPAVVAQESAPIPPGIAPFEGRPIRRVTINGVDDDATRQRAENQIRTAAGSPVSVEIVADDVRRLNRLGRFRSIEVSAVPLEDGSVELVYALIPTPIVQDVQVAGNRQISDDDIFAQVFLLKDTPVDRYQLDRATRRIEDLYRSKGYSIAAVTIDEDYLEQTGIVLFQIREGDRVKVTGIRFDGNDNFGRGTLMQQVRTRESALLRKGPLDEDQLEADVASLITFYKNQGYLDVRADTEVRISPDAREAIVTFLVAEGPLYRLRSLLVETDDGRGGRSGEPTTVIDPRQIAGLFALKPGDPFKLGKVRDAITGVVDAYGKMGWLDAQVRFIQLRDFDTPQIDLVLVVSEGTRSFTGTVEIVGNDTTQDRVLRREIDILPGRPLDATRIDEAERNLRRTQLVDTTEQPPRLSFVRSQDTPAGVRDVVVEVHETDTGAFSFGASLDSDLGVAGVISLTERNFDLFDPPETAGEFFRGEAFKGAGQTFSIDLQPGTEVQTYSVSLNEPSLFESDYGGGGTLFFRNREYTDYDEQRLGARLNVSRRFGTRWSASASLRAENINIDNIDESAPTDVYDVEGENNLTSLGFNVSRTSYNRLIRPTKGSRTTFGAEFVGALAGDFTYPKFTFEHTRFFPLHEDVLGRTTVLQLRTEMGYIPADEGEVPVFERFYLGGRSLRGLRFRTVSPKGIANDTGLQGNDPVGGTWSFFLGAQIERPVLKEIVNVVFFVDSGTVTFEPGFDDYRVTAGFGIRLYVPQLSQAPLAFDFGFPVIKNDNDEERVFSFSIDLPF